MKTFKIIITLLLGLSLCACKINNQKINVEYVECTNNKTYVYNYDVSNIDSLEISYKHNDSGEEVGGIYLNNDGTSEKGTIEITINEKKSGIDVKFIEDSNKNDPSLYSFDDVFSDYSKETYSFSPTCNKVDGDSYLLMEINNGHTKDSIYLVKGDSQN